MAHYRYAVTWSPEDEEFVATVAEFPSLSWLAPDRIAALEGLDRLLRDVVADLCARGEEVPLPFSERRFSGNLKVRVPPERHRQLVIEAQEAGVSLNRYVNDLIAH
ncbi:type II toxin-antitoxin system HicB family antitoxin [Tersicoccus phoenicis]|uniref:type II toxin-antitoxin system HicB family antitoxin n=1 Tax=Tersicoccus phoenicis TaxID=554083 RepID=UPI001F1B39B7|nr:toxin-antitoxin system HicB family antitoxin [Tersicoccus phoenicis]